MGRGATATLERLAASLGQLDECKPRFEYAVDVPNGGVLLALPALLASGLLRHASQFFTLAPGFYGLETLFLLLAFMALARLKSIEALRYCAPGEWGKLLGLDRVPEVRTLRAKLKLLAESKQAHAWSATLCKEWMATTAEDLAGFFYIDGHVRVYHGSQTDLPKHYVARERLCLRATADYWVNAMDGQPFFVVSQAVDPGLLSVLEEQIVPRLEEEFPAQACSDPLNSDPYAVRFTLVFDREGYSPAFFARMKSKRIACLTYHKHPGEEWPETEFTPTPVALQKGERITMKLAERGTYLEGGKLWVREIRKLNAGGHQTAVLSTHYQADMSPLAVAMFARWSQENFFRYMRQHYSLDSLVDYGTEVLPETTTVVNPAYRKLDGQVRKQVGICVRLRAEFGAMHLNGDLAPQQTEAFEQRKGELHERIVQLEEDITQLKAKRKATPRHIPFSELPKEARFDRLSTQSKHFIDTLKMIAYRAETAMVHLLREHMTRHDDARRLLLAIYSTEIDLLPDPTNKSLTVRLHPLANDSSEFAIRQMCQELNNTETLFPGTELRLIYESVSAQNR
jgi:hypothetical protein